MREIYQGEALITPAKNRNHKQRIRITVDYIDYNHRHFGYMFPIIFRTIASMAFVNMTRAKD